MNSKVIIFLLILSSTFRTGFGQKPKDIVIGHEISVFSDTLDQERSILIHLPKSYNDTIYSPKDYPVLVLLDAQEHFDLATGIVEFMGTRLDSKLIPEFIIVGVKSENRISDYTPSYSTTDSNGVFVEAFKKSGKAKKFLSFVEFELIPKINKDYRTSSFKVLSGHSLGGLLAVYDFVSPEPLFDSYIAMDPSLWWARDSLTNTVQSYKSGYPQESLKKIYISGAHNSASPIDTTAMRTSQEGFYKAVQSNIHMAPKVKYEIYDNEDHGTVPLPSLYKGLQFIFENYRMADMLESSAAEIQEHFLKISPEIGMELRPEERVIDILGNYFLESANEVEKAIAFFKLNTINYPGSYHAFYALAKAERKNEQLANSIANYKKSLTLKPNNKDIEEELKMVIDEKNKRK